MKQTTLTIIALALLVTPLRAQPDPQQSRAIQLALVAWFECEECNSGELQRVVKYGKQVVPILAATVQRGPAPASRELYRLRLQDAHGDLQAYAKSHPQEKIELPSQEQYVQMYLDNYAATYKVRAAKALAAIGGDEATAALRRGLQDATRDDVKEAITRALEKKK
jgi:hypothetical protein